MCIFAKYKDILGKPRVGIHSYRFFDMAILELVMIVIVAFITSYIFKTTFLISLLIWFLLGIILHRLFCVRTTIDKLLFN